MTIPAFTICDLDRENATGLILTETIRLLPTATIAVLFASIAHYLKPTRPAPLPAAAIGKGLRLVVASEYRKRPHPATARPCDSILGGDRVRSENQLSHHVSPAESAVEVRIPCAAAFPIAEHPPGWSLSAIVRSWPSPPPPSD